MQLNYELWTLTKAREVDYRRQLLVLCHQNSPQSPVLLILHLFFNTRKSTEQHRRFCFLLFLNFLLSCTFLLRHCWKEMLSNYQVSNVSFFQTLLESQIMSKFTVQLKGYIMNLLTVKCERVLNFNFFLFSSLQGILEWKR